MPALIPAATSGLIPRGDRNAGYLCLRSGTLFLIVGVHAVLFGGLLATLPHTHGVISMSRENSESYALPALSGTVILPRE